MAKSRIGTSSLVGWAESARPTSFFTLSPLGRGSRRSPRGEGGAPPTGYPSHPSPPTPLPQGERGERRWASKTRPTLHGYFPACFRVSAASSSRTLANFGSSARFFVSCGSAAASKSIAPPLSPAHSAYRYFAVRTATPRFFAFPATVYAGW